ncbi:MAG TPA: SCO family protein [Devosia sp.]|nr:SCO family protein [Devosia sp.]
MTATRGIKMALHTIRTWLWIAVIALAVTVGAAALLLRQQGTTAVASTSTGPSTFGKGSYELVDHRGAPVDETMFIGQPSVLFFGFTHCPEVCPTTMAEMASWFETLGPEAQDLRAYFVTVDPERDTPEIVGEYASWAGEQMTGVTGTPEEIAKIAKAWGVYYEKVPLEGDDYTMDHTASVYLIDAEGEFQGTVAYREDKDTALGKLRNLLAKS